MLTYTSDQERLGENRADSKNNLLPRTDKVLFVGVES
jgi:hypothetical protein